MGNLPSAVNLINGVYLASHRPRRNTFIPATLTSCTPSGVYQLFLLKPPRVRSRHDKIAYPIELDPISIDHFPSLSTFPTMPSPFPTKTVVVLGASYGGARAARLLSQSLPAGWRVVVIDRNSHMNREIISSYVCRPVLIF